MMSPYETQGLEILIDQYSLEEVLAALADICSEKSDHIQSNWQDAPTFLRWNQMSSRLNTQSGAAGTKGI